MQHKRILLVDDEESILKSFRKDFKQEGYEVTTAPNGEEAISILQGNRFALIVTDLVMPGVDGITVLKEAKRRDPEVATIILTGYGDLTSAIEALRLGADDYLLKPCDSEELLLRSSRCLEKQEANRKIKMYEQILPICSYCKSIRDDTGTERGQGKWMRLEEYFYIKGGKYLSHGCCPLCYEKIQDGSIE